MATYVNDLRLKEIATGDESGTWGTSTNTNLELIAEAFSFGTEAITTNADTHTTTIADGSTDPGRSIYLKYTGTLDSACTITIGPNTVSKLWFIENGTSGSQNIIISQGSGANVTIPNGHVKAIYSDGAGSGAAMVDAFTDLNLAGTTTVDVLNVSGALTGSSTIQGTTITATTAFVPDASDGAALGTSSLEFSDLFLADAAVINLGDDQDTTLTHVADTGILLNSTRQLQFGDSGTYIHQSADGVLDLVSDTELELNATTIDMNGNLDLSGTLNGISILADATNFTDSILISQNASTGTLSSATDNVGIGDDVFAALTSGRNSVAIGSNAMDANTSGKNNVAVGHDALSGNTTADENTAIGKSALEANTTGTANTAVGANALDANQTNSHNTAVGTNALSASVADFNTAVGSNAGILITTGTENVALGGNSLDANTTGSFNVAVGTSALGGNTTASNNVAVGTNALVSNTTGDQNTAVGGASTDANTTGIRLTAIGYESLTSNTTGDNNTALGHTSLSAVTTGSGNVGIGYGAGAAIDTGSQNVCIGQGAGDGINGDNGKWNVAIGLNALSASTATFQSTAVGQNAANVNNANATSAFGSNCLASNTSGSGNNGFGYFTLNECTTGDDNAAFGTAAGRYITTGDENTCIGNAAGNAITTADKNTLVGKDCGNQITTGGNNTAVGFDALTRCTTGTGNACVGKTAGDNITTGANNVCIGVDAGNNITQGSQNVCIGDATNTSGEAVQNCIVIGDNLSAPQSNSFAFGKSGNVVSNVFTTNATFTRNSDLHKKTNIEDTDLGLSFINELKPVTFNWKPNTEFPEHYKDYSETENHMDTETNLYGMIAQDVEKALDKVGHKNFGGWSQAEDGSQHLAQGMFIYPLINAVKELSSTVEELKAEIKTLKGE